LEYKYKKYFKGVKVYLTEEMIIAEICNMMNWDYYTYINQPYWFLETVKIRFFNQNQK